MAKITQPWFKERKLLSLSNQNNHAVITTSPEKTRNNGYRAFPNFGAFNRRVHHKLQHFSFLALVTCFPALVGGYPVFPRLAPVTCFRHFWRRVICISTRETAYKVLLPLGASQPMFSRVWCQVAVFTPLALASKFARAEQLYMFP